MTTSTPGNDNDGTMAAVVLPSVEEEEEDNCTAKSYDSEVDDAVEPVAWRLDVVEGTEIILSCSTSISIGEIQIWHHSRLWNYASENWLTCLIDMI